MLESLGVELLVLPFELHPEIPTGGRPLGDRGQYLYARIAAECEDAGLPFQAPARVPNTRRALETAEWIRQNQPGSFDALHVGLFQAHFADGDDIGDPDTIDALVARAGGDHAAARADVETGAMRLPVDTAMETALEAGVSGTPAWLIGGFLLPGVQPRELYERVVTRLRERGA